MSVIDEVKQRTDIVDVVGQHVKLTKSGRTFRGLCPFHSEKHPSFFVYPERQSWHCFGACNSGGDVFSFVMKKESMDFGETLRLMAQRAGVSLPSRFEPSAKREEEDFLKWWAAEEERVKIEATMALSAHTDASNIQAVSKNRTGKPRKGLAGNNNNKDKPR